MDEPRKDEDSELVARTQQGDAAAFEAAHPNIVVLIDELGSFLIGDVAPGVYRLEVDLADRLIVVDDLPLDG